MFKPPSKRLLLSPRADEGEPLVCGTHLADGMGPGEAFADKGLLDRRRRGSACEEEFKVLTPAQRQPQGIQPNKLCHLPRGPIHGNPVRKDPSPHPTLLR